MKTLIVEDDELSAGQVRSIIDDLGWESSWLRTFDEALKEAKVGEFTLLILDRLLGDGSGDALSFIDALKEYEINPAIIILSSLGSTQQRIDGLDRGGDAYVIKPFDRNELRSIITSIGRRLGYLDSGNPIIQVGKLEVRTRTRLAIYDGQTLQLTTKTYAILRILAESVGEVVSRERLWQEAWPDYVRLPLQNMPLETAIRRLRAELRSVGGEHLLTTVRGKGYQLQYG